LTSNPTVNDWTTDFDVLDPSYIKDPFAIWDSLRQRCPVAHTDRRRSTWLPTRYADINAIAHDTKHFSSEDVGVIPFRPAEGEEFNPEDEGPMQYGLPPISADPPLHTWTRRLLLPWFSHRRVASYVPMTRSLCQQLLAKFASAGHADAAVDYAQQIPVRVIAHILGVPEDMSDTFTRWVRDVLEFADDPERRTDGNDGLVNFFIAHLENRKKEPADDLISELLRTEVDGKPIDDSVVLGMAVLLLIAGVDTTWSSIGSALWHLATHPDDQRRLRAEPEIMPLAIEELLRAYSPVTMARLVKEDFEYLGCPMHAGDSVLLPFNAANRDPDVFEHAETVDLGRKHNRHIAFGAGIHRCAGSNLARMELQVAIEEWLKVIPEFKLADPEQVAWAGGQVRGPRVLPVEF
jgi:cytochrome P450